MKPQKMYQLAIGAWTTAAATALLKDVVPRPLQPLLHLTLPAAITASVLAGAAAIVAAQERHTDHVTAAAANAQSDLINHLNQLVTQVTEISKSDQNKLSYLRGMIANSTTPAPTTLENIL